MTSLVPWFGSPYSGDIWDPFNFDVERLIWGSSGANRGSSGGEGTASTLAQINIDWQETDNAHIFRADLPGVKKEDVKVQVEEGNILQISGQYTKEKEQEDKNDKWHRVERLRGSFMRRFKLPENTDLENVKCVTENGVLTVTLPKKQSEEKQQNVRAIDIQ